MRNVYEKEEAAQYKTNLNKLCIAMSIHLP